MVEKKPKLLLHPGPPRSGTTYLFDLIAHHDNLAFRETIQPSKGWKYIDHLYEQYQKGRIDAQGYLLQRMRFKENRLTQPNIIQVIERCLQIREWQRMGNEMNDSLHKDCHAIIKGFNKTFPKTADVHLALVPHLANIQHLYGACEKYKSLYDKDGHLFTADEVCEITSDCISIAKETYVNLLNGFADSELYDSIDFVVNLRNPRDLFKSNMQNQMYISNNVFERFDLSKNFVPAFEHLDNSPGLNQFIKSGMDRFDPFAILQYVLEHDDCCLEMDNFTARHINEYYLYNVSMMRVYEQFIGIAETFKDHPIVNVKFLNEDVLNNAEELCKVLPYYQGDMIKESVAYQNKTNSVRHGVLPEKLFDSLFQKEDTEHNIKITKYQNFKFADKLINLLVARGKECCNFNLSTKFVEEQNTILDK